MTPYALRLRVCFADWNPSHSSIHPTSKWLCNAPQLDGERNDTWERFHSARDNKYPLLRNSPINHEFTMHCIAEQYSCGMTKRSRRTNCYEKWDFSHLPVGKWFAIHADFREIWEHVHMTSENFSGFWTSPPCPNFALTYTIEFTQPPLLHLLLA